MGVSLLIFSGNLNVLTFMNGLFACFIS